MYFELKKWNVNSSDSLVGNDTRGKDFSRYKVIQNKINTHDGDVETLLYLQDT